VACESLLGLRPDHNPRRAFVLERSGSVAGPAAMAPKLGLPQWRSGQLHPVDIVHGLDGMGGRLSQL
jgi:hypothetical protein